MNQSERDKIVKAGNYLEAVYDGITDPGVGGKGNTIKEKVYGKLFKEKGQESHHYIKLEEKTVDENGEIIAKDLNEKANRVQALVDSFAADLKYKGETPRILIGDLPPGVEAFASPENNTIAIDRKVLALADANKVLTLVGHELGHFNSYDANTESTAKRVEDAIQGTKNKGKYTEKIEKEFQEKYAGRYISGNEAQKVIDGISEDNRENKTFGLSFSATTTLGASGGVGTTFYVAYDPENRKFEFFTTGDASINIGTPSAGVSVGLIYFPKAVSSKDIEGKSSVIGGGAIIYGGDIYNPNPKSDEKTGFKVSIGLSVPIFPAEIHAGTINESRVIGGVDEVYLIDVENGIIKAIDKKLNLKGVNYWKSR